MSAHEASIKKVPFKDWYNSVSHVYSLNPATGEVHLLASDEHWPVKFLGRSGSGHLSMGAVSITSGNGERFFALMMPRAERRGTDDAGEIYEVVFGQRPSYRRICAIQPQVEIYHIFPRFDGEKIAYSALGRLVVYETNGGAKVADLNLRGVFPGCSVVIHEWVKDEHVVAGAMEEGEGVCANEGFYNIDMRAGKAAHRKDPPEKPIWPSWQGSDQILMNECFSPGGRLLVEAHGYYGTPSFSIYDIGRSTAVARYQWSFPKLGGSKSYFDLLGWIRVRK